MENVIISPVAIGLISDPPTIVLSYDCISKDGEKRKRRKRKMPLRDFTDRSNVKRYAFNLRQRHIKYLENVIDVTIEKLLRIIQEIQRGNSVGASLEIVNKEYTIDEHEDLNKLSPAKLAQRKAVMEEIFQKNLVKPGDPAFVYDREVHFEVKTEKCNGNDWDEDSDKFKSRNDPPSLDVDNEEDANKELSSLRLNVDNHNGGSTTFTCNNSQIQCNADENPSGQPVKELESKEKESSITALNCVSASTTPIPNSSDEMQKPPKNDLPVRALKSDDESSSVGEVVNIESGFLEEEDEDFWQ